MPSARASALLAPVGRLAVAKNALIIPKTVPSRPINGVTPAARLSQRTLAYNRAASRLPASETACSSSAWGRPTFSNIVLMTLAAAEGYCWQSLYARRGSSPPFCSPNVPSPLTNSAGSTFRRRRPSSRSAKNVTVKRDMAAMGNIR